MTARADEDGPSVDLDLLDDENYVYGGGGSAGKGIGSRTINTGGLRNETLVVRGGLSTANTLLANQANDSRGFISANAANGSSLDVLATTPSAFPNGQITVTTVGQIREIGMNVISDASSGNPYHAAIIPQNNPMTAGEAHALSNVFQPHANVWK